MEVDVIKSKISDALVSILEHDNFELHDELTAKDVDGWDSLSHMMIITKIEEEFSIRFKLRDLNKLKNLGSLVSVIQNKI
ncbi:acyl carrier protein [Aquimarina sp. EL_43]|uniref:acyl carrier protein n=1 Tax=Aquimarina TaxID=290174 RepID=UPI000471C6A3|nr:MULTISPECIES: acyl carrier protein [Aquimarina]MBG6133669.1 acyl carrier protein [Aquimarina sp. EL_35]MBG6153860.1 acyl carrier protein [Aquimarina sp. EL_32]MBG6172042.1 acyl carrier protein [Aquimarina sp. EL_43]